VLGILILIQRSSSDAEDKSTNVKTTSLAGIILLSLSLAILILSRIISLSDTQKHDTGYTITTGNEAIMFFASFVLVFCASFLGILIVFVKHLTSDMYYQISLGLLVLSVILAGYFSSREDTFGPWGKVLLVLIALLIIGAGVTISKVSIDKDEDLGAELKTSFKDLPVVAWSIGGFTILMLIFSWLYSRRNSQPPSQQSLPSPRSSQVGDEEFSGPVQQNEYE
jgi:uncharacterized protein YpmS